MFWHIDTDIISLIVMAAIYIYERRLLPQSDCIVRDRRYFRCLEVGIAITVVDILASVIMEVPTTRFLYHLIMTSYFVTIELVIVEWIRYVLTIIYRDNEKGLHIVDRIVLSLYALYVLFNIANLWTGHVYSLGPNNEYSRGPFFFLMLALYILYTVVLFVLILVRHKHIEKGYPSGVLLATPLIIAVAIAVQLSTPGWLMIMPAYMICLLLAFLFLQTMREKDSKSLVDSLYKAAETDVLTGLYNRAGMEMMVQKTLDSAYGQNVLVLIADIDDLKHINDDMGHAEGDRAIHMVAMQLKRHFRTNDTIVRYGGDEFLAFLIGTLNEPLIHRSLQKLIDEIGTLRIGEENDVSLHGSIGAACGVVGLDSFETLCCRADAALYHVKRNGKNGYALYKPEMELEHRNRATTAETPVSASKL